MCHFSELICSAYWIVLIEINAKPTSVLLPSCRKNFWHTHTPPVGFDRLHPPTTQSRSCGGAPHPIHRPTSKLGNDVRSGSAQARFLQAHHHGADIRLQRVPQLRVVLALVGDGRDAEHARPLGRQAGGGVESERCPPRGVGGSERCPPRFAVRVRKAGPMPFVESRASDTLTFSV